MSEIVIWLGSRKITEPEVENVKKSFNIDEIRPVNLPFIQEEMTLWRLRDKTASWTGNTTNIGFLTTTIILETYYWKYDADEIDIVRLRA